MNMEAFGQPVASSQPGYFHTQDLMNVGGYSRENFNQHQQSLHQPQRPSSVNVLSNYPRPSANPYWRFGASAISPLSSLNLNASLYSPMGYVPSQVPILAPPAGYRKPQMTRLNHDNDIIENKRPSNCFLDLISMALEHAPGKKLSYHQICNYVYENFPFYLGNDDSWQRSISYTLTFNNCFRQITLDVCDPRKGTCWTFDPRCQKMLNNTFLRWKQKKHSESKPSKELDHNRNMTSLTYDSLAGPPESSVKSSPALDTSPCIANFPSTVHKMRSNWASIQLMKDFSSYKQYSVELSTCRTNWCESSSLPGEPIAQGNLPKP